MRRLEFSDQTTRIRRNMVAVAALIAVIRGFDIRVGKATASGLELENLTTEVVLLILFVTLVYLAVSFTIRAYEEYRYWELTMTSEEAAAYGGKIKVIDLAYKMQKASDSLDRILANTGLIRHGEQNVFTEADAVELKSASKAALQYGARFDNFPKIMRVRFWVWDILLALLLAGAGAVFYLCRAAVGVFSAALQ